MFLKFEKLSMILLNVIHDIKNDVLSVIFINVINN